MTIYIKRKNGRVAQNQIRNSPYFLSLRSHIIIKSAYPKLKHDKTKVLPHKCQYHIGKRTDFLPMSFVSSELDNPLSRAGCGLFVEYQNHPPVLLASRLSIVIRDKIRLTLADRCQAAGFDPQRYQVIAHPVGTLL